MATMQEYYNQLGTIYDPQVALIKQQQAQIPGQIQAQKSALEQAKINAFRDISNTASAKGMTFSGFTPNQQATYVGEKFLPAMANLETAGLESQNALTQALNKVNAERSQTALGYYENAQQAEAANAAKIQAAQIARQAKLESAQISASATAQKAAQSQASKYKVKQIEGDNNYMFSDPTGTPITMAEYVANVGLGSGAVLNMLRYGTEYDKNVYQRVKNLEGDALEAALSEYGVYGF